MCDLKTSNSINLRLACLQEKIFEKEWLSNFVCSFNKNCTIRFSINSSMYYFLNLFFVTQVYKWNWFAWRCYPSWEPSWSDFPPKWSWKRNWAIRIFDQLGWNKCHCFSRYSKLHCQISSSRYLHICHLNKNRIL